MARGLSADSEEAPPGSPTKAVLASMTIALVGAGGAAALFIWATYALKARHLPNWLLWSLTLAYALVVLCVALLSAKVGRRLMATQPTAAEKRHQRRVMAVMSVYCVVLIGVLMLWQSTRVSGPWLWLLAVAPALPLSGAIVATGLYLREETDEFQRAIHAEAALWATGGMLAITNVWGFLEMFRVVPYVPAWLAFVVWCACLGPAHIIARRRYQ